MIWDYYTKFGLGQTELSGKIVGEFGSKWVLVEVGPNAWQSEMGLDKLDK